MAHPLDIFVGSYLSLSTLRKTGERVGTPVWFARVGDPLYVATSASSGKYRRIAQNPAVTIAPCTAQGKVIGATLAVTARLPDDPAEQQIAERALARKYGLFRRCYYIGIAINRWLRRRPIEPQGYIAIQTM